MTNILRGFQWNQAVLSGESRRIFDRVLLVIMAFGPDGRPGPQGTGFILFSQRGGRSAVAMSAAHVFHPGVSRSQSPNALHHPTSLLEFLPQFTPVSLDQKKLRVAYSGVARPYACVVTELHWNQKADQAIFVIEPDDGTDDKPFDMVPKITRCVPKVGDVVEVLGYADMAVTDEARGQEGSYVWSMQRRLLRRAGRVKDVYPQGHHLLRGPCIETTIPVFPGMSGGPAVLSSEPFMPIEVFGFVSSDTEDSALDARTDRSQPGSSIIGLLSEMRVGR